MGEAELSKNIQNSEIFKDWIFLKISEWKTEFCLKHPSVLEGRGIVQVGNGNGIRTLDDAVTERAR